MRPRSPGTVLQSRGDAVLDAELPPVELSDCRWPMEAIKQALRIWAPAAQVTSVRFAAHTGRCLARPVLTARVYGIYRGSGGKVVLQVHAHNEGLRTFSAMVDFHLPAAAVSETDKAYSRI